jgi:actinin alpha
MQIEDITKDLESGVALVNLYEIISEEQLPTHYPNPKNQFQKIDNLTGVLKKINSFISSVGIRVEYSTKQVLDCDKKQILGMIWVLIHKFEIQDISEEHLSARDGLLLWCKKKTAGYRDVNVHNFGESWQSGLAFCALIHRHRPDLIDYDSLDKSNALHNLNLAFEVAEKNFDIASLLDAQDMVDYKPDEKSVMTYVAKYWKYFAASDKTEKAGRLIGKHLSKRQRELDNLIHDYQGRAEDLLNWIDSAAAQHNVEGDRNQIFGNSLEKALQKSSEFKIFKENEKPPRGAERVDLEITLTNIRASQKNEGLVVYTPPEHLSASGLASKWQTLNEAQEKYERALREHIIKLRRIDILLKRFRSRAGKIREWQEGKTSGYLAEDLSSLNSVSVVQAKVQIHSTFDEELSTVNENLQNTKLLVDEIISSGHEAAEEVSNTANSLQEGQQTIAQQGAEKLEALKGVLAKIQEVVNACIEFAKKSEHLNMFFEDADLSLTEPVAASSVDDVQNYDVVVENLEKDLQTHKALLDEVAGLNQTIKDAGRTPTQFTPHTYESLAERFEQTTVGIEQRRAALDQERVTQQGNDHLLQEFANTSSAYTTWSTDQQHKLSEDKEGTLQEQLDHIRSQSSEILRESNQTVESLKELISQLDASHVLERSEVTLQDLSISHDNLEKTITKISDRLEQEILEQKGENISADQLKEFKDTFVHFDKDNNHLLNKLEFKAATASLGEDMDDSEINRVFDEQDADKDNQLTFDEYIDFISKRKKEGGGYDAILASFKSIAGDKNYVTEIELRSAMEKEEAEYLIGRMAKTEEGFDYESYLRQAYGK